MRRRRAKKRAGPSVHTHWFPLYPGMPLGFWVAVGWEVRRKGIRSSDRQKVRRVCREIAKNWAAKKDKIRRERWQS